MNFGFWLFLIIDLDYDYEYNYPFGLQLIANSQNGGKNSFFMRTLCLL